MDCLQLPFIRVEEAVSKKEEQGSKTARKMVPLSFFGSRLISRAIKTENPLPRSLFAPKPNGNACYAG